MRRSLLPPVRAGAAALLAGGALLLLAAFSGDSPSQEVAPIAFDRWPALGLDFVTNPGLTEKHLGNGRFADGASTPWSRPSMARSRSGTT